uniref:R13L1/DRL21-like LRR repeat region domain-containing protein n=1 Tax=Populus trichocarpa TaxID=3694 RepID=A0A2K1R6I0_POPTR
MRDLGKLDLRWSNDSYGSLDERVLHQLKPDVNVHCLVIVGYGGSRFPAWLIDPFLVDPRLSECHCSFLPPLGQLAYLKRLMSKAFDKVESVGYSLLKEMEQLGYFHHMREPKRWKKRDTDDGDSWKLSKKTRHLSYARTRPEDLDNLVGLDEVQNLRTILLISKFFLANMNDEEISDFLRRFQSLRVLSLLHLETTMVYKPLIIIGTQVVRNCVYLAQLADTNLAWVHESC